MTYLEIWEKLHGKEGVKRLPAAIRRHIKRMDALPKPVKKITAREYRELMRGL